MRFRRGSHDDPPAGQESVTPLAGKTLPDDTGALEASIPSSPVSWERVERAFEQVAGLPEHERRAFLESNCSADAALRAEVEALLLAHDGRGVLDQLGEHLERAYDEALAADLTGTAAVEGYRLLSRLGTGGMGDVFLAERTGEGFTQRVALKVLRPFEDDSSLLSRFHAERKILAALEHPGIPRFIDSGVAADGSPFLAMELVEGVPIDRYCADRGLRTTQRLELFAGLCDAIHYAHQHLVVHRDLKPSNVLVTDAGGVRVLDFGIAKLLSRPGGEVLPETRAWMTLPYASPEQIRGDALTTAVDVYSLGVLLFELLVGQRPFSEPSVRALQDAILEREPPRLPSLVTEEIAVAQGASARRLRRDLSGDLETIVAKAMHKLPDRRYESVRELADDVRRHLRGLPVRARPETLVYRAGKFMRRHRRVVAAAALAGVGLGVGLVASIVASSRALESARRAREARDRAQSVSQFVIGLFGSANPVRSVGGDLTPGALLDSGLALMRRDLATQPEARAMMLDALAQSYEGIGRVDDARRTIDEAVALLSSVAVHDTLSLARALATQSRMLLFAGQADSARRVAHRSLALFANVNASADLIATELGTLSDAFLSAGQIDSAEHYVRAAAARARESTDPNVRIERLNDLAAVLAHRSRWAAVESTQTEVLALSAVHRVPGHTQTALNRAGRGVTRFMLGRFRDAQSDLAVARRDLETGLGTTHPYVATTYQDLGRVADALGELDSAAMWYARALVARTEAFGGRSAAVARSLLVLAGLETRRGRLVAAESLLTQSRALRQALPGDQAVELALLDNAWANLERERGRFPAALAAHARARQVLASRLAESHRDRAAADADYAFTLSAMDRHAEADSLLRHVRPILEVRSDEVARRQRIARLLDRR
jgi:serine/threonine-protein kinase